MQESRTTRGVSEVYAELFNSWKREKETNKLQPLPKGFYRGLSQYVRALKEEARILDEKTLRASLISAEMEYVRHLATDLFRLREQKILLSATAKTPIPIENLTEEEEEFHKGVIDSAEGYDKVLKDLIEGRLPHLEKETTPKPKRILIRFLREIPAIAGIDMNIYGPFKPEDIASIPAENAEILVRQGAAVKIEA